jgi:predicted RNase H-like HicB family nuclease
VQRKEDRRGWRKPERVWDSDGALSLRPMSAEREFDVVIVDEPEGGYSVFVPDLPSVATQGETIEEARANAACAASHHIMRHRTVPDAIPVPVHGNKPIKRGTSATSCARPGPVARSSIGWSDRFQESLRTYPGRAARLV